MISMANIDQLVALLFSNSQFTTNIQNLVQSFQYDKKISSKKNIGKNMNEAMQQIYGDMMRIVKFNLNETTNQFKDILDEIIKIKKDVLELDVVTNKRIQTIVVEINDLSKLYNEIKKDNDMLMVQQKIKKNKIKTCKSISQRLVEDNGSKIISSFQLEDCSPVTPITQITSLSSLVQLTPETYQTETEQFETNIRYEFEQFKKSLKKIHQERFESIWKAIIGIKQKLNEQECCYIKRLNKQDNQQYQQQPLLIQEIQKILSK